MTTAREIISDALSDIGIIAMDETPSAADANACLRALNRMINAWQNERLIIFAIQNSVFPFVAGQQSYTLGTGGDFNISRPVKIENAYARDQQGNDYPIQMLNDNEWSQITAKYISTSIPCYMNDTNDYPLKTLNFWPKPSDGSWSVSLWYWDAIQSFATLDDVIELPPGYEKMIEYNLAVEIAPKYGVQVSDVIINQAIQSKAQVKRINYTINILGMPDSMPGTSNGVYTLANFLSGV